MKNLPLNSLFAFWHVYKNAGLRSASREMEISHSSVWRHVKELEAWLGVKLVEKKNQSSALDFTSKGLRLGAYLEDVFPPLVSELGQLSEEKHSNQVVISTTSSIASCWLMPRLPEIQQNFPNIEIHILIDQKLQEVREGKFDIAIRMGAGNWNEPNIEPLMDDEIFPVCVKGLDINDREGLRASSLIHDGDPVGNWQQWLREFYPEMLNDVEGRAFSQKGVRLASSDLVLRAILAGQGVGLIRRRLCQAELEQGLITDIFPEAHIKIETGYWLVGAARHHQKKATRYIWDWLLESA